jgi:hypothetical protein
MTTPWEWRVEQGQATLQGSLTFIGTATVLLRLGSFVVLTDPNFLHRGQRAAAGGCGAGPAGRRDRVAHLRGRVTLMSWTRPCEQCSPAERLGERRVAVNLA